MNQVDTLIIGGGQAGLAISYYLSQAGREHLVLEKKRIASAWRDERWDSFTLVTPNWALDLPEMEYSGHDPDGFLTREQVVDYIEGFASRFDPPVREGVEATAVEAGDGTEGFVVSTRQGSCLADNVVVATGTYQRPRIPSFNQRITEDVLQIHSSEYRNPGRLPAGAVLVVGSGQSGCQIAEELHESGRDVYLATGSAGRAPRRYRGQDTTRWMEKIGYFERTVDQLDSPAERFRPSLHVSGKDGGRTLNLHRFYRDGMTLLGHIRDGRGGRVEVAPDLDKNLAAADKIARDFKLRVDKYILEHGLEAPEDDLPELREGYEAPVITELDLMREGIATIIWATGYGFDFSWVNFPIFDEFGYPIQERGVTPQPGLYFVGLHWLHTIKSGLLAGVGADAAHVAGHIESRA